MASGRAALAAGLKGAWGPKALPTSRSLPAVAARVVDGPGVAPAAGAVDDVDDPASVGSVVEDPAGPVVLVERSVLEVVLPTVVGSPEVVVSSAMARRPAGPADPTAATTPATRTADTRSRVIATCPPTRESGRRLRITIPYRTLQAR